MKVVMSVEAPKAKNGFDPVTAARAISEILDIENRLPLYRAAVEKSPSLGERKVPVYVGGKKKFVTGFQFLRQRAFALSIWQHQLEESGGNEAVDAHTRGVRSVPYAGDVPENLPRRQEPTWPTELPV